MNVVKQENACRTAAMVSMTSKRFKVEVRNDGIGLDSRKLLRAALNGDFVLFSIC